MHALAELQLQLQRKLFLGVFLRSARSATAAIALLCAAAALLPPPPPPPPPPLFLFFLPLFFPLADLLPPPDPAPAPLPRCSLLPEDLRLELGVEEAELGDDVGGPAQEVLPVPEHDGDLIGEEEPLAEAEL